MTQPPDLRQAVLDRIAAFPTAKAYADHTSTPQETVSRFINGHVHHPTRSMLADLASGLLTKYQPPARRTGRKEPTE